MKNVFAMILAIALTMPGIVLAQVAKNSGAKVYVAEMEFDFGYIHGGQVASHSYFLHNRGSDSLRIIKVHPKCGCTKAPLKKEVVGVGDSAEIELVFTSNKGVREPFRKTAVVTCNDNEQRELGLAFRGTTYINVDSLRPLTLSNPVISFDSVSRSAEIRLTVKNVSESTLKMELVSVPWGYLNVDIPESEIEPGKTNEITVRVDPSVTDIQFKKSFTFVVDDSAKTRYTIPVALLSTSDVGQVKSAPQKKSAASH